MALFFFLIKRFPKGERAAKEMMYERRADPQESDDAVHWSAGGR